MANVNGMHHKFSVEDLTVNINTVDRPQYLDACLSSLLRTTPAGVSLQIVFNGSPEETVEKTIAQAQTWDGPTNFVVLEEILPISESHNSALASVETSLVNFMGDDDVVLGNRIPVLIDVFNRNNPTPVVVTSHARRIAGDPYYPKIGSIKKLGPTTISDWRKFHQSGEPFELLWPGAVLDVEALRSIGGFEQPFEMAFDCRIFSQMSFVGPVISSTDRQFGFRIHQGSMSSNNWDAQRENLRYIGACHRARVSGSEAPSLSEFLATEARSSVFKLLKQRRRDRSQMLFRSGGQQWLSGQRMRGGRNLLQSALTWPPAFVQKVLDQSR